MNTQTSEPQALTDQELLAVAGGNTANPRDLRIRRRSTAQELVEQLRRR